VGSGKVPNAEEVRAPDDQIGEKIVKSEHYRHRDTELVFAPHILQALAILLQPHNEAALIKNTKKAVDDRFTPKQPRSSGKLAWLNFKVPAALLIVKSARKFSN
jgi:hypothetical protein